MKKKNHLSEKVMNSMNIHITFLPYIAAYCCKSSFFQMRRNVRPYFLDSPDKKRLYDAGTFFYTRFTNVYLASNFCLLELVPCLSLLG